MSNQYTKIQTKIIFFVLVQIFLVTGLVYSTDALRIPIGVSGARLQEIERGFRGKSGTQENIALAILQREGMTLLDIGTHRGLFLDRVAGFNPKAKKLKGIDRSTKRKSYKKGEVEIEVLEVDTQAGNWLASVRRRAAKRL